MSAKYSNNTPTISVLKEISTLTDEIKILKKQNVTLEAKYRHVFDGMTSCMAVYEALEGGQDFIFKDFNLAAEMSGQISRDDIIGKSVKEIFPGVVELGLFEVFKRVYNTGLPELHPISHYQDQRITLWVENYVYKLPTGEIVAIYDDITDRKKAEEALKQRMAELEAINAMSRSISMNISLDEVVDSALNQLMQTLEPDLVLVYLLVGDTIQNGEMRLQAVKSSNKISEFAKLAQSTHKLGECLCGLTAIEKKSLFSLNIHKDVRCIHHECKMAGIHSYASLPLMNREKLIGVLGIGSCDERNFSVQASFLQSLAGLISAAITNTILNEQVVRHAEQLMNQAVKHAEQLSKHADELEKTVVKRTIELKKFFNAVESSPACIVITDIYGNIEYANPFFTKLTGYTFEEAKGQNPRILKSGFQTKEFYEEMWQTLIAGETWRGEICNRKKNGELYWENVAISPLHKTETVKGNSIIQEDDSEKIINYVAVKEDITEKKIAQRVLQESEQRYKAIFEWSQDGIIVADHKNKKFLFCNNSASNMFGYRKDELVGKSVLDIHPPADLLYVLDRFQRQSKGEITCAVELPCMKKDGTVFYCDITATALNINGQVCSMGFFRDVTERRRTQEMKDDVDRIMRHDLKSPLSAIIGFPQMMMDDENLTASQKKYLKYITNAGQNMLDLINLSLTIYQIETGKYQYTSSRFNLLEVLQQCVSNSDSTCKNRGVTLNFSVCGIDIKELDRIEFNGERLLAFSVFSNLVVNAVEASPDNETIDIMVEPIEMPMKLPIQMKSDFVPIESAPTQFNGSVRVIIHNHGVVPLNIRNRFFDKYVTSGKLKGTGLGTYSAKLLAKSQGWDIEMRTSEDAGTYLIVTIF